MLGGHPDSRKDDFLAIVGEDGKGGMKAGTEKKGAAGSLMDPKRHLYPSKSRAHLKKN